MKTLYLRNKILEHVTGQSAFTMPSALYLGLVEQDPTVEGLQTDEVSGGSYARQEVSWTPASGSVKNDDLIEFDAMPATQVKYWALFDASTDGNMLYYFPFSIPLTVQPGKELTIASDNLILREV